MFDSTKKVIDILVDDYFDGKILNYTVDSIDDMDIITVGDNTYSVTGEFTDDEVKDLASYIYNNTDKDDIIQEKVSEDLDNDIINSTDLFIYKPSYIDSEAENDVKLSKYVGLPCKITDKLITSKEENDGFVVVSFDIEENEGIDFIKDESEFFVVFDSDLEPYNKEAISESLEAEINTSTALLTALQSEKEAIMIYETLISKSTNEDEIELLTKILDDEKEHVALLSGLQSANTAEFVAEDNKTDLDDYAQEIIDTAPSNE